MATTARPIKESTLNQNINDLVHSLVRDLAMACKKVSIYGPGHPLSKRSVEKPFLALERFFTFRKRININIQNGNLFILNIRLKDSVFNLEIVKYMQLLDVKAIVFKSPLSMNHLEKFLTRFVQRVNLDDENNHLSTYLAKANIETIEVNSETAFSLFEEHEQYRGDMSMDFSLRNMVLLQLPDTLAELSALERGGETVVAGHGIDFDPHLVKYVIPEKVNSLQVEHVIEELTEIFERVKGATDESTRSDLMAKSLAMFRMVDFHSAREIIVKRLDSHYSLESLSMSAIRDIDSPTGKIRLESSQRIETVLANIFEPTNPTPDMELFVQSFVRLMKTGQQDKAYEIASHLVVMLAASDSSERQKALGLLLELVRSLAFPRDTLLFNQLAEISAGNVENGRETFEYSEFLWQLIERAREEGRFEELLRIMQAVSSRRHMREGVTVYDSIGIKKVLSYINQPAFINGLIDVMLSSEHAQAETIRKILVAAGSEEIALALSNIISHPNRQVRQQALKILADLGKASLKVCSQILMDDTMFERDRDRHELADNKWYIIRNAIFVLGLLRDPEGCIPLRLRISDSDVRVRREIIATLEKIGGEEACDILVMMADDSDREIREKAIITVGLIGDSDMAPVLINMADTNPKVSLKAIAALGRVGGGEAEEFLCRLLEGQNFEPFTTGEVSKEDVKLAVVRALGQIGNDRAINKIKEFKKTISSAQKLFFKNSPVNRAIDEILSRG